jgi:cytidylate kinase
VADAERRRSFVGRVLGGRQASNPVVPTKLEGRMLPGDDELRLLIKQVLASIANEGSVVIVSHAASFALSGPEVLRVLVTASPGTRARRLAAARDVDLSAAQRQIKQEDAGRADYLKRFYGVTHELPTHFDVVVNTDVLSPDRAGEVVVAAAGH